MSDYLVLSLAIVLNAVANIMMKVGMTKIEQGNNLVKVALKAVTSPVIVLGVFCFAAALGLYTFVLQRMNLSIAYPIMTSVGYMIVVFASWIFLKEQITLVQSLGFLLIIGGVWLVAS